MTRWPNLLPTLLPLAIAACGPAATHDNLAAAPATDSVSRPAAPPVDAPPRPHAASDPGEDKASAAAAVEVVRLYYRALAARDYATAYAQWRDEGRASGKSQAAFAAGFAHTRSTRVTPGAPVDPEGAAGSSYVSVPVTVEAELDDGTVQHFAGAYLMRRVNDVPGATPEELRWHIQSASLHRTR